MPRPLDTTPSHVRGPRPALEQPGGDEYPQGHLGLLETAAPARPRDLAVELSICDAHSCLMGSDVTAFPRLLATTCDGASAPALGHMVVVVSEGRRGGVFRRIIDSLSLTPSGRPDMQDWEGVRGLVNQKFGGCLSQLCHRGNPGGGRPTWAGYLVINGPPERLQSGHRRHLRDVFQCRGQRPPRRRPGVPCAANE